VPSLSGAGPVVRQAGKDLRLPHSRPDAGRHAGPVADQGRQDDGAESRALALGRVKEKAGECGRRPISFG
jgi:hypothetical protein